MNVCDTSIDTIFIMRLVMEMKLLFQTEPGLFFNRIIFIVVHNLRDPINVPTDLVNPSSWLVTQNAFTTTKCLINFQPTTEFSHRKHISFDEIEEEKKTKSGTSFKCQPKHDIPYCIENSFTTLYETLIYIIFFIFDQCHLVISTIAPYFSLFAFL